jgi:CBS domain-containing protein
MKSNARKSSSRLKAKAKPAGTQLKEIMTPNVVVVSPTDTLQIAARKMQERDIGFLPVCDGERLVGTLSDRDIAVRAVAAGFDPRTTPVRDFATAHVVWCFDDEPVDEAAQKMQEKQIRRLMVLDRDQRRLVGVVSLGDLAVNGTRELSGEVLESVSPAAD